MSKTVDIIGTGLTAICYDWESKNEKWSVGSAFGAYKDKIDTYFCMHQGQNVDHERVMRLEDYPLGAIKEKFDTSYFNNSIAYMIAYAIWAGYKQINLWGVDIEKASEYEFERPCVLYWIGIAKAMDVKIESSSMIDKAPFKYGYDSESLSILLKALEMREKAYRSHAEIKTGDEKNQWIGAMYATQKIIDFIKG